VRKRVHPRRHRVVHRAVVVARPRVAPVAAPRPVVVAPRPVVAAPAPKPVAKPAPAPKPAPKPAPVVFDDSA